MWKREHEKQNTVRNQLDSSPRSLNIDTNGILFSTNITPLEVELTSFVIVAFSTRRCFGFSNYAMF